LQARGVECWRDVDEMRPGSFWRFQIRDAIARYDKVILLCSAKSLERPNVLSEIVTTMHWEREATKLKLIPLRLDDSIFETEKVDDGPPRPWSRGEDWRQHLQAFHIPDFSKWRNRKAYTVEFEKLLDALRIQKGT